MGRRFCANARAAGTGPGRLSGRGAGDRWRGGSPITWRPQQGASPAAQTSPTPSWGGTIADGRGNLFTAWFVATIPGLVLMTTVPAVNSLGDGLRDALDPRLRV